MKKAFYLILFFWGLFLSISAQDVKIQASWSTAIPVGDMTDFCKNTSGRGAQLDVEQKINDRFSFGGNFAWQTFYEKDFQIYNDAETIRTGWQRNYVNALLLMATSKYYFATSVSKIKAYLSLEAGITAIENYEIFGIYEFRELNWHFALSPALGVDIPAGNSFGFNIFIKFPNSFKNNSDIHYSWINTGVGVFFIIPND